MAARKKKHKKEFLHRMKIKLAIVSALVLAGFLVVIGKMIFIQTTKGAQYERQVLEQQRYDSAEIPFRRGDIFDRNGTALATSEKVYTLVLEPKNILLRGEDKVKLYCIDPVTGDRELVELNSRTKVRTDIPLTPKLGR